MSRMSARRVLREFGMGASGAVIAGGLPVTERANLRQAGRPRVERAALVEAGMIPGDGLGDRLLRGENGGPIEQGGRLGDVEFKEGGLVQPIAGRRFAVG